MIRIPLLKDNHNHLFTYSGLNNAISLFSVKSKKTALELLSKNQNQKIIVATGWFDSNYTFSKIELDELPPVIICNNSLHCYLFNQKASAIISETWSEWVENNNNQPWVEANIMKIIAYISDIFGFDEANLNETIRKNLNLGVCFASDMFVKSEKIFDYLTEKKGQTFTEIWTDPDLYDELNKSHKQMCRGIKLFTDGAIGASTAAISGYKNAGLPFLTYSDKGFAERIEQILNYNTNIAIHAIGDIAIEQIISTLEHFKNKIGNIQIRLEHAQFITKNQAKRARDLDIVLSMQPNFNMDSLIYADRLTEKYCIANNPFRMLIDDVGFTPGKNLIFGSDGMPTGVFDTLQQSLFPPIPGQKISLDEFVAAYCSENFEKGHINVEIDQLKKKVITNIELV